MQLSDIVTQLQATLPNYTGMFSDSVSVTYLAQSGGTATAACSAAHGLQTGDYALVSGALAPNALASLTASGGIATAKTANPHDLTQCDGATVNISGANESLYNGSHKLLQVEDEYTFTFAVDLATPATATGAPQLNEDLAVGYNGRVAVTVVDTQTFTYAVSSSLPSPAAGIISAMTGIRITGVANMERLSKIYTEQEIGKSWLFAMDGGTTASRNRQVQNDAAYRYQPGQTFFQEIIQSVKLIAVLPATTDTGGRQAADAMEQLRAALFKALLGVQFESALSNGAQYGMTYLSDALADYNGAYYAHQFNFEIPFQVDLNDICAPAASVAMRGFDIEWLSAVNRKTAREIIGKTP